MTTKINFKDITDRLEDFVEYFRKTEVDTVNPCKVNDIKPSETKTEDKLYRLFLETHFQSPESATRFIELMNWNMLNTSRDSELRKACHDFFKQSGIKIGGHRKHLNCMNPNERAEYSFEGLLSYKEVITRYGSQSQFFEIGKSPDFDDLYNRMQEINHFKSRLPRFDHLEKVSRTFNFYCTPNRFYVEDATGPLDGLTYLVLGKKFRSNKTGLKEIVLSGYFITNWNSHVGKSEYKLSESESQELHSWLFR